MKLLTFLSTENEKPVLGALADDGISVVALQSGLVSIAGSGSRFFTDAIAFLDGGNESVDLAHKTIEFVIGQKLPDSIFRLQDIRLMAPVPVPRSIRDCMAFEKHIVQATRTVVKWRVPLLAKLDSIMDNKLGRPLFGAPKVWFQRPLYYKGNTMSVVGHDSDVICPSFSKKLDYELEFGVYIGKKGRDLSKKNARDLIAGYTIFNDFSCRDIQLDEMEGRLGPAKGKDFDTGNVMGPYLVTPDEIPDPYSLEMTASVNGEEWSRGNSRDMHFSFEEIISYISRDETLYPGEFIGSGTVGNGCGLELDRWIKPGDVVELKVGGLGVLRNRIICPV